MNIFFKNINNSEHNISIVNRHVKQVTGNSCNWWKAALTFFSTGGEYGNWCGKGRPGHCSEYNKPEIQGYNNETVCNDEGFDNACDQHDHGAYSKDIWGFATVSLCQVDKDFKKNRNDVKITNFNDGVITTKEAKEATNCLFDMMPCLRYESYSYWGLCSSWWGVYPCSKSTVGMNLKWPYGKYLSGGCNGPCYRPSH